MKYKNKAILVLITLVFLFLVSSCSKKETVIKNNVNNSNSNEEIDSSLTNNIQDNVDNGVLTADSSLFFATFLDVEQGDCAIINCNNHFMIIDGGSPEESSKIYTYLKNNEINHIDLMIASHPDSDHIGGLSGALNYATVDNILCSKVSDTKEYTNLSALAAKNNIDINFPNIGDVFMLDSAKIEILAVNINEDNDNNSSIVLKVTYGDTTLLFTGDAEKPVEEYLVSNNIDIDCDLLKVAHHGSKNSTSQIFLDSVTPSISVISVGKNNSYGHPSDEVLLRLKEVNSKVYMTNSENDIVCTSNKKDISCVLMAH